MMLMQVPMASLDRRSYAASHFNCLDLRNGVVPLTKLFVSSHANACAHGVTWPHKSCSLDPSITTCSPHFDYLDLRNALVQLMKLLTPNGTNASSKGNWIILHFILVLFTKVMEWCHWEYHQHHVMPLPVSMVSYDQKHHVAPHFLSFWPKECSGMTWFHISLGSSWCNARTSYNANASTNGITWPKKSCFSLFWFGMRWHWCKWHCMTKKSYYTSFQLSQPTKCNDAISDTVFLLWCWDQWSHMTKNDMLQTISIVFT